MKSIEELKKQAWALQKVLSVPRAKALDAIAQREGFPNWMRFLDSRKATA